MTWDAYNRRKEVLHQVLAIAELHRGETAAELLAEIEGDNPSALNELDLLFDAQMAWSQILNSRMDSVAFLGDSDLESAAIEAWHAAADDVPVLRHLLDSHVDMPELQTAFKKEHEFLARAAGIAPDYVGIERVGRELKHKAASTKVYAETIPGTPAGIFGRLREALAA